MNIVHSVYINASRLRSLRARKWTFEVEIYSIFRDFLATGDYVKVVLRNLKVHEWSYYISYYFNVSHTHGKYFSVVRRGRKIIKQISLDSYATNVFENGFNFVYEISLNARIKNI